jgi:AraC-like DNA-binding protein
MTDHLGHGPLLRARLGGYNEFVAPPQLASCVEAMWEFRPAPGVSHRLLPDPSFNLAFSCQRDDTGRPANARLLLIGPINTPRISKSPSTFVTAAIKVKLEAAIRLFELHPNEHADTVCELSAVLPAAARTLLDELTETRSTAEALSGLSRALERHLPVDRYARIRPSSIALDLVRRTAGRISVRQVAMEVGLSVRQVRRVVERDAGVSIKTFARTVRFLHAVTSADRLCQPRWARVAAEAGFFDQSHLVREFREICGLSPVQLLRERRAEAEISKTCSE